MVGHKVFLPFPLPRSFPPLPSPSFSLSLSLSLFLSSSLLSLYSRNPSLGLKFSLPTAGNPEVRGHLATDVRGHIQAALGRGVWVAGHRGERAAEGGCGCLQPGQRAALRVKIGSMSRERSLELPRQDWFSA